MGYFSWPVEKSGGGEASWRRQGLIWFEFRTDKIWSGKGVGRGGGAPCSCRHVCKDLRAWLNLVLSANFREAGAPGKWGMKRGWPNCLGWKQREEVSGPDQLRLLAMMGSHSPQALGRSRRPDQSDILRCHSTSQVWSEQGRMKQRDH